MDNIPQLPDKITLGDCYGPAMEMTDADEAARYFEALIQRRLRLYGETREEAIRAEHANLGYYSGYYDTETRRRVEKLFGALHPLFGAVDRPDPVDPFALGYVLGKAAKDGDV